MNEPQFSYSELTLDELRSMAASPQVGSMQAMPQSFHALADRVGEVADLLSHAQADLPNWWKGPAAEQAAATLGRAAAEAREFHGSALAAASAVSRCAQVVAEQQHQMMNVPSVQEPGITDVVQRSTTALEALNAARQDATYQAAHEQAVQVVNGIAAQYVETRSQLSNIGMKFGDNFAPAGLISTTPTINDPHDPPPTMSNSARGSRFVAPSKVSINIEGMTADGSREIPARAPNLIRASSASSSQATAEKAFEHHAIDRPSAVENPVSHSSPEATLNAKYETPETGNEAPIITEPIGSANPSREILVADKYAKTAVDKELLKTHAKDHKKRRPVVTSDDLSDQSRHVGTEGLGAESTEIDYPARGSGATSLQRTSRYTSEAPPDKEDSNRSPFIPPYSILGSGHRTRDERNARPAYLKERKSAWLPDTVAAPADGVIGPAWFEQH